MSAGLTLIQAEQIVELAGHALREVGVDPDGMLFVSKRGDGDYGIDGSWFLDMYVGKRALAIAALKVVGADATCFCVDHAFGVGRHCLTAGDIVRGIYHCRDLAAPTTHGDGEPATDARLPGGAPVGPRRAAPTAPGPAGMTAHNNERED